MKPKTYTLQEVYSNINILKTQEEDLLNKRSELNQVIRDKREQIKKWEQLDNSQYKAF